jgi:sec-independent protein translocase protein TatA
MLGIGGSELLVILILALILFGTGRIPAIMEDVAKGIKAFKKGLSDIGDEVNKPVQAEVKVTSKKKGVIKKTLKKVASANKKIK